jgi:hypothetical protein
VNTYQQWSDAAKTRAAVVLADGRTATLVCAYQWRRTCKIQVHGRYMFVFAEDVKLIWASDQWVLFEPWPSEAPPSWSEALVAPQRSVVRLVQATLHPSMIPAPLRQPDLRA